MAASRQALAFVKFVQADYPLKKACTQLVPVNLVTQNQFKICLNNKDPDFCINQDHTYITFVAMPQMDYITFVAIRQMDYITFDNSIGLILILIDQHISI